MEGSCKRNATLETVAPRHPANRSLGGNVNRVRIDATKSLDDVVITRQREADFRISWAGNRVELLRREENKLNAEFEDLICQPLIGAHDPVDLGTPCIRSDEHAHD